MHLPTIYASAHNVSARKCESEIHILGGLSADSLRKALRGILERITSAKYVLIFTSSSPNNEHIYACNPFIYGPWPNGCDLCQLPENDIVCISDAPLSKTFRLYNIIMYKQ